MSESPDHEATRLLTIGQCASLACLLEVSAPKPGNVHRSADFEDVTFYDFAASAVAIAPAMDLAVQHGVGPTVLAAIRATRAVVSTNTNLGMVLLLAPLAAVPREVPLQDGVANVLDHLSPMDANCVYEAIRIAQPGGMGEVKEMDVAGHPPDDLQAAMQSAADRDWIARQYVERFVDVLGFVTPVLTAGQAAGWSLIESIVHAHLQAMCKFPDSLIARKCGPTVAREAAARAGRVLEAGNPGDKDYYLALGDLDLWLRADGHRRNPGTTADLIAAGLFVGLREGILAPPYRWRSSTNETRGEETR